MAAFEQPNDQTSGTHTFLDIADALHALPQVGVHRIGGHNDHIGLASDRPFGERTAKVYPLAMSVDSIAREESANFKRLVLDDIDQEDLLSQHSGAFFEVKSHGALGRADVIVSFATDSLHVVFANCPRRGETRDENITTAAEAEQQMRFDCTDGNDEVGFAQM